MEQGSIKLAEVYDSVAKEYADKLGFPSLYLFTPNLEKFYKKQGWETVEQTVYRNENIFIMRINAVE